VELESVSAALPFGPLALGVNLTIRPGERAILRRLVLSISESPVLTAPVMLEDEPRTKGAINKIRERITDAMLELPESSPSLELLSHLRNKCNSCRLAFQRRAAQGERWEAIRLELIAWRVSFAGAFEILGNSYEINEAAAISESISKELRWGFPGPSKSVRVIRPPDGLPFDPDC
jgi:hypothetical protein